MRRFALAVLAACCLFLSCACAFGYEGGDTGTYRILEYTVTLTPQTDGTLVIDYHQKWQVTGGHIPWITVGMPNGAYNVTAFRGDVASARDGSSGDQILTRLDLKKDFQANETFEVGFTVTQSQIFSQTASGYMLEFTPGWYDRATTDLMEIHLKPGASLAGITASPQPNVTTNDEMIWTRAKMAGGEHFTIALEFPKSAMPNGIDALNLKQERPTRTGDDGAGTGVAIAYIAIFFGAAGYFVYRVFKGGYTGGSIGRGGGYYGGGCVHSCACACACAGCACACACEGGGGAGCACACACEGGGGAGCSRKSEHKCRACSRTQAESADTRKSTVRE